MSNGYGDPYDDPGDQPPPGPHPAHSLIQQLYEQVTGGKYKPTEAELSQWDQDWKGGGFSADYVQMIKGSIGNWWTKYQKENPPKPEASPTTPPPTTPPPGTPPPKSPTAPPGTNLTDPFGKTFTPPPDVDLGGTGGLPYIPNAPHFEGPAFPNIPKWKPPTAEEALNDEGYKFVRQQGQQGIENWAAARGTLNDSSAAKSLSEFNQNAATTQYANVWNRQFQGYNSDVDTQYLKPWEAAEQNWLNGTVGPGMTAWTTMAAAGQRANELRQTNARNDYRFDWDRWRDQRDSTWDKVFQWATA